MTFKEAYHNYLKFVKAAKAIDIELDEFLDGILKEYQSFQPDGLNTADPDCDMLICELGNYDWTGEGEKFEFSIRRQFLFEDLDEPGVYGFIMVFDRLDLPKSNHHSEWCQSQTDIENWLMSLTSSAAYLAMSQSTAKSVRFILEKPH